LPAGLAATSAAPRAGRALLWTQNLSLKPLRGTGPNLLDIEFHLDGWQNSVPGNRTILGTRPSRAF
jgi:hypothetical protein